MKIAVTGGNCFIGLPTIYAAEKLGHEAWSFDRADGNDIMGSLDGLKGADAVIHLAGVLGTHELFSFPEHAVEVNITGSLRIMNWCIEHRAAYVGIMMPDVFPSIYTATKIAAHRLSQALCHSAGLHAAHVRAFNAYGPGQKHGAGHPQKIMPTFATNAWRREPLPIWGTGNQTVDMIHVDDLARMLVDATQWAGPGNVTFDGGTGVPMTVLEVAQLACKVAGWEFDGSPGRMQLLPMRRGEVETQIVATGEGWDRLGWRPRYDQGLMAEAIGSYRVSAIGEKVVERDREILDRLK